MPMTRPRIVLVAFVLAALAVRPGEGLAQIAGNAAYGQGGGKARAQQQERDKRTLSPQELPPDDSTMFVEANVLMNVEADSYVAVFAIAREGESPAECARAMDASIRAFSEALKPLGVEADDILVDFVAQARIYGFEITGDLARERLEGFELKKNVLVRFRERDLLDRLMLAAAGAEVFDLIKVDYLVADVAAVRERLAAEAAAVLKRKVARYETLLDTRLRPPAQVIAERPATYYPSEMYDSYIAAEAEAIGGVDRQRYAVQSARKSRTFHYNGLDSDAFDAVIGPDGAEPVVQFTLYLKVRYAIGTRE
jgi:uncharacterized protein YggE